MRSPNCTAAVLSAMLLLATGLVPASAAALCGPAAECGPCGSLPTDARIVAACCCCGDLAAAESAAPDVAEGPGEGSLNTQSLHASASPALSGTAETGTGTTFHTRVHRTPPALPPLFQLYQSLLI